MLPLPPESYSFWNHHYTMGLPLTYSATYDLYSSEFSLLYTSPPQPQSEATVSVPSPSSSVSWQPCSSNDLLRLWLLEFAITIQSVVRLVQISHLLPSNFSHTLSSGSVTARGGCAGYNGAVHLSLREADTGSTVSQDNAEVLNKAVTPPQCRLGTTISLAEWRPSSTITHRHASGLHR